MRNPDNVFHLAIPCRDLDEAYDFYVTRLGCKLARRYNDRITLDFFGDQVVCHLSDQWDRDVTMYPRHFGVTFKDKQSYDNLLKLAKMRDIPFFQEPTHRFQGLVEEHETFFLIDPSNNLLEFKYYFDDRMMY
ncbi:VOC family protein [Alicyclobacillus cycloheptanicus]|uniref:Extradiol dioxygenase family protein n=1 Tax=Alicyclobacillus cycloheptanicus TaxID=1457 RepID=A0ABT9XLJ9_9BACL|nr:VOC family protein [Alicyclobacillus cycloheptanicus]MDQ0191189.1 extradiol dioxygenase family protein [Alicyclobacillus cycloheptanicus]WDM02106.1 VOC family protein [Alicyclobacillus cycloheptanicus]